jgi:Uma2 family endonuclease
MTYEAFLETDFGERRVEWVDGEVVEMGTISDSHNDLGGFLLALIRFFVDAFGLGAVRYDPFNMRLQGRPSGRCPDILFVANENRTRLQKNHLDGPADLVVEIISPDDPDRDRVTKFREYEQGGVREYWLIDRDNGQADFYLLGNDGRYHPLPVDEDGLFRSVVLPGLRLKVEWLWQDPLPPLLSVLKEWQIV